MKAAFAFTEQYPNFDQAFQTIGRLSSSEFRTLDTYIWAGVWNLFTANEFNTQEQLEAAAAGLLRGCPDSLVAVSADATLERFVKDTIYVVQFDSIRRGLAIELHRKLRSVGDYLGLFEVNPDYRLHRIVFSGYGPLLKIEKGELLILHTGEDGKPSAQDKLDWLQGRYTEIWHAAALFDTDLRFTVFDARTYPAKNFAVQQIARHITHEFEVTCEHVLYKLLDVAPQAADELGSAISRLRNPDLDPADCAQLAVSLRRCLEKTADALVPPQSKNDCNEFVKRLGRYLRQRLAAEAPFADYAEAELLEIDTKIRTLHKMGSKGVHEDWYRQALSSVALGLILLLNDLLIPVPPARAVAYPEPDLFDKIAGKTNARRTS